MKIRCSFNRHDLGGFVASTDRTIQRRCFRCHQSIVVGSLEAPPRVTHPVLKPRSRIWWLRAVYESTKEWA